MFFDTRCNILGSNEIVGTEYHGENELAIIAP